MKKFSEAWNDVATMAEQEFRADGFSSDGDEEFIILEKDMSRRSRIERG